MSRSRHLDLHMYSLTMDLNLLHRSAWSNQQQFSAEHSAVSKPESITSGWERDRDVFVLLILLQGFTITSRRV